MKKVFFISALLCCLLNANSIASSIFPQEDRRTLQILLNCKTIDPTIISQGPHRTPPQIPDVYFDASASTVYFENPCYECTLELVVPGTETVAYSYNIPDGDDSVQLPAFLSGDYELHIHRGNYCFWGVIDLC